jgi:aspartyl protease family protein
MMPRLRSIPSAIPAHLKARLRLPAFVLVSLALILLMRDFSARRDNPNPNPVAFLGPGDVPHVVLKENQVSQYVASGRINGHPVEFLIDTGAVDVAMPYIVSQTLGLTLRPGGVSKTGNGDVRTWTAHLDSVDVGGLAAYGLSATVLPNMQGDQVLLGMAYLRHMELVLRGGEMTLRPFPAP